ncbi:Cullin repeat-like-containing domain protein [Melampsora americana]|nr:Cullin repeat-like-containing domain protein [Melampsora americana]
MSSPAPGRRTNASLRTRRPTTYYDTEKDSTGIPNIPRNPQYPPDGSGRDLDEGEYPNPSERSAKPSSGQSKSSRSGPHVHESAQPSRSTPRPREQPRGLPGGPAEKSKVGAALRSKRQSVSYGPLAPARTANAPPMPTMPKAPGRYLVQGDVARAGSSGLVARRRNEDGIRTETRRVQSGADIDLETLAHDKFDPEKYLKVHLSVSGGSDPQHLKDFKDRLRSAQVATNQDLQENVYKNYSAFVAISKEIATLENEMLELKTVLEEFKTLPGDLDMGLGSEDTNLSGGSLTSEIRKRTARNSVADVNALYRAQLEALWENVEGSQKFLPIIPGRHLVSESKTFVELNSITYKPKHNVHLFLLNDTLLVAVPKRTGMGSSKVKLVADKCFNLGEISVTDLKDGGDLDNAVKITRSRETVLFKTDRSEDKRALLSSFKKGAEELASRKRKQSIMEAEQRRMGGRQHALDGYGGGERPPLPTMYEEGAFQIPSIPNVQPSKILGFGKNDPTGKDLSWIGDLSDELSVSIACRAYDEASELIEKSKTILAQLKSVTNSPISQPSESIQYSLLKSKIDEKSQDLMQKLFDDLLDPTIRKTQVIKISSLITKLSINPANPLGSPNAVANIEKAKRSFLSMRSELVKTRSRMIKFEGDIALWVSQLAMVIFTLVKNTCEWYMTAFRDNRMASGFVRWAAEQIELYASIFRRQVYGVDQDAQSIQDCMSVTKAHSSMLKEVGLDFGFLLESLLNSNSNSKVKLRRRSTDDIRFHQTDQGSRKDKSLAI